MSATSLSPIIKTFNGIFHITFTLCCSEFLDTSFTSFTQWLAIKYQNSVCGQTVLHWVKEVFCATGILTVTCDLSKKNLPNKL